MTILYSKVVAVSRFGLAEAGGLWLSGKVFVKSVLNPFTAVFAASSHDFGKRPIKVPNLKLLGLFCPLCMSMRNDFYRNTQH